MKDKTVLGLLASRRSGTKGVALKDIRKRYHALCASEPAKKCRRLRNRSVAHFLLEDGETSAPTTHAEVLALQEDAERLADDLFAACGAPARYRDHAPRTHALAEVFWAMVSHGAAALR